MDFKNLRINGQRLRESLEKMASIGGTPGGGVHRLTVSDEDRKARDVFVEWVKAIDLDVKIDEMGNIFSVKSGKNNDLTPVMTGSHIDTQPKGGRFDGILGVMGGLEVLRTIHENRIETIRPVILVDWTNEEGTRFSPPMAGSGVWAGKLDQDWIYSRVDNDGKTFGEELERIGYKGSLPTKASPIHAYFEYHIEQGPILEKENKLIGIPEGVVGLRWCDVHITGTANQVGPTPMEGRNDALCAAAEMILKVNTLPDKMGGNMVATVGEIHNFPNSRNIVPDRVHFTVDIRSWDDALSLKAWKDVKKDFEAIAEKRGCPIKIEETWDVDHIPFDERLVARVSESAKMLGYPTLDMRSGAGHDAVLVGMVAPTAMIFVPSIGGRSHVEIENTTWEDCEAGANVLLQCVLASAMEN